MGHTLQTVSYGHRTLKARLIRKSEAVGANFSPKTEPTSKSELDTNELYR
jgi:hypothetical protein